MGIVAMVLVVVQGGIALEDSLTAVWQRPEMFLPNLWPSYFKKSEKIYLWDLNGKKYTDMIFAVGQNILGYKNTDLDNSVISSIKRVRTRIPAFFSNRRKRAFCFGPTLSLSVDDEENEQDDDDDDEDDEGDKDETAG